MANLIEWPRGLISPKNIAAGFTPWASDGTQLSLSGRLNNGASPSLGIWKPDFNEMPVAKQTRVSWLALEAQILGRDLAILVPYYHDGFYPQAGDIEETALDDETFFDDGSGIVTTGTHVIAAKPAEAGEARLSLTKICCEMIRSGHVFSIGHHQYKVRVVESQDSEKAVVTIAPELRTDISSLDEIDFVFPSVKCRLIDPTAMNITWQYGKWAFASLSFIEDTAP